MVTFRTGFIVVATALALHTAHTVRAQAPGGMAPPGLSSMVIQLFGDHKAFTANLLLESEAQNKPFSMPGKLSFLEGKSRLEMDMSGAKGAGMSPQSLAQLKAMGMTEMVLITTQDQGNSYLVYPGLKAYAPAPNATTAHKPEDYKLTRTNLGTETVDGHSCQKQKVMVKTKDGDESEATLWLAKDLKDFPIVIEFAEGKQTGKLRFQEVKFDKPASSQFQPPAEFTKYNSMQEMMTSIMLKRFGGAPGRP